MKHPAKLIVIGGEALLMHNDFELRELRGPRGPALPAHDLAGEGSEDAVVDAF